MIRLQYSLFQALGEDDRESERDTLFLYQTPLVARPLFQSSTLTESLEQAISSINRANGKNRIFLLKFTLQSLQLP